MITAYKEMGAVDMSEKERRNGGQSVEEVGRIWRRSSRSMA